MSNPTKEITFLYALSEDLQDRIRVTSLREKDKILKFVVQYEAFIRGDWQAIIRYDTSHGFAHKDIIHYNKTEDKQPLHFQSFNMAFTFAIQDLKTSWRWYRIAYVREIENEERDDG
jgi:hypothetical protein